MGLGAVVRCVVATGAVLLCAFQALAAEVPVAPESAFALPPATIENTIPPALNRAYFEGAGTRAFPVAGPEFSLQRAWWLAEAALLAYADEEFATRQFTAAGLQVDKPYSLDGTQAYIAFNPRIVIVAFRGTQIPKTGSNKDIANALSASFTDIATDSSVLAEPAQPRGCAHGGFVKAWASVSAPMLKRLRELKTERPERTFWFTGHSLGGALAALAAVEYGAADGLYTFGAPPVGDAEFIAAMKFPAFRFVNYYDAVPGAPIPYLHVGTLRYFNRAGELADVPALPDQLADGLKGWAASFSSGSITNGDLIFPRSPLTDHSPLYYALLVRHALDSQPRGNP